MKPNRCTLLLSIFISTSLRVSGNCVPIIRRTYCICATLVFFTLYPWLSGLLVGMRLIPTSRPGIHPYRAKIPVSPRYSKFSWWWAHSCLKHVEKMKWIYEVVCTCLASFENDYTGMHGQQNLKNNNNRVTYWCSVDLYRALKFKHT